MRTAKAVTLAAAIAAALLLALALDLLLPGILGRGGRGRTPELVVRRGGILKIGTQAVPGLDPHFATSIADIQLLEQVFEHLTYIGPSNRPVPELASRWDSPDGRTWTFTLREGARFSTGRPVTAADVAFSFDRLRDPKVDTPVAGLFRNIREVRALGERRVQFLLADPNPEFAGDVSDYHAAIVPAGTTQPARQPVGSGPFQVDAWFPWQGAILKPNPFYDQKGRDGQPLPYLAEVHLVYAPRLEEQVAALRGGKLDYIGGLSADEVKGLRGFPAVRILAVEANMHWVIHLRSDAGHLAADNRVRQALKLGTDHQALANTVRPGLASVGNGFTPVGPAFGMYHLVRPPFPDPARARRLLAEAGHADGLELTLHVQNQSDALPLARAWKEQMVRIGVRVDLEVVSPEEYYGGGERNWLNVDFGITDWGARLTPEDYFRLAYTTGAPWNETHWSDPEFDELTRRIDREMNEGERVRLYHQAQEILIERGPVIVAYFVRAVAGVGADLRGVALAADWPRTRFQEAWFARPAP